MSGSTAKMRRSEPRAMKAVVACAIGVALLSACQTVGDALAAQTDGLALAQTACGGCHAVEEYGLSPVAPAPEFARIANTAGLTRETLTTWLSDAHNYPEDMSFTLDEEQTALLVEHILSLRREGFTPSI